MVAEVIKRALAGEASRPRKVAAFLGVSSATVYACIERGEIRANRIGKTLSIPASEVLRIAGADVQKAA